MMSTCCSKHVEAWNKHVEKECIKLVINQNYVEVQGQQNIENVSLTFSPLFPAVWNESTHKPYAKNWIESACLNLQGVLCSDGDEPYVMQE